jgi:flagellar motor switch protein FliG
LAEEENKLSGAQKSAILLLAMGEEAAVSVMRNMRDDEVSQIGEAAAGLAALNVDTAERVLEEFSEIIGASFNLTGSDDYVYRLSVRAFGEDKAAKLLKENEGEALFRERIERIDPVALAGILKKEQPQTIAMVMSSLGTDRAGRVLVHLDRDLRQDISLRLAHLDRMSPDTLREIQTALAAELGSFAAGKINGREYVAEMLIGMTRDDRDEILNAISDTDVELGEEIRKQMFTFDDLLNLDARGMQRLGRDVDNNDLMMALKTASDQMKDHWFNSMSSRAAQMLQEDLEAMGPARLREVEESQQKIVQTALSLAEAGELDLGGDEMV